MTIGIRTSEQWVPTGSGNWLEESIRELSEVTKMLNLKWGNWYMGAYTDKNIILYT